MEVDQQKGEFMFQLDFFDSLVRTDLFSSKTECRLIRTHVTNVTYKKFVASLRLGINRTDVPKRVSQTKKFFIPNEFIFRLMKSIHVPMQQYSVQEGSCEMSFVSTFDFTTTTDHSLKNFF